MDLLRRIIRQRKEKKRIKKLYAGFEAWKNRDNKAAECGQIYNANDEQPLINRLNETFDKHHGY